MKPQQSGVLATSKFSQQIYENLTGHSDCGWGWEVGTLRSPEQLRAWVGALDASLRLS